MTTDANIIFRMLPDGGFIVGDRTTGLTSYAFPTSIYAEAARFWPARAATLMLQQENKCAAARAIFKSVREFDAQNWNDLLA